MIRMLCVVFPLLLPCAIAADDAPKRPSPDERLLRAIALGDLAGVKDAALGVDVAGQPNLLYHALASPNADVVEFLRAEYDLKISDLHIAAIRGDGMKLRHVLANLDNKSKAAALTDGYQPPFSSHSLLALAVRRGHVDAVRQLIAAGANVNEATRDTLSPLANAAELGHAEIVTLLLQAGVNVNAAADGYTPLMRACVGGQAKTVRLLLDAGANPNLERHDGQRALHFAAKRGESKCVELVLAHGADIDAVAYGKDTALTYAELYKHEDVVNQLRAAKPK
jgi:ankyrin repeat protein